MGSCSSCKQLQKPPVKSRAKKLVWFILWTCSTLTLTVQALILLVKILRESISVGAFPQHETNAFVLTQEEREVYGGSLQDGTKDMAHLREEHSV